jgi:hypothetical protein
MKSWSPWAQRCPDGHCSWESSGEGIWCQVCEREFSETIDLRERDVEDVNTEQLATNRLSDEAEP